MDHVIDCMKDYFWSDMEDFYTEWFSGDYKKLSDCPHYKPVKAYCEAVNALNKSVMINYTPVSPKSLVRDEKERRR